MEMQSPASPQPQQQVAEPEAQAQPPSRGHKRSLIVGGALSLALLCPGLTVWALRKAEEPKREEARQAVKERDEARQAEARAKKQLEQEVAARQAMAMQRNQALAAAREAQRSLQVAKAVLVFLQKCVLSSGNTKGWGSVAGGKEVTLRQAVNAAEPKVAEMFADKPLVEASVRQILGTTYLDLGEPAQAVQQYERALALREAILGPDHPDTGECRNQLAIALRRAGRPDDAARLYEHNRISSSHAAALAIRGAALLTEKKPIEAELKLRESLSLRQRIQPDDWTTFDAQSMLGAALMEQKKYAAAERLLLSGYEGMKQRQAKIPAQDRSHLIRARERLVHLYEIWGKPDEAAKWRKESEPHETAKKP
jgi:tetratricopeptide (TPR) repeat protein